ncbi:MAG: DUF5946 family protein [Pyrinomonadaceae bacterium]
MQTFFMTDREAYDELCCYTLSKGDVEFIHQHVVDAFAAQTATADDKPIKLTFALIGLYLHLEHGFSGREVQLAHMKLARSKREWPRFELPEGRGEMTARDVLQRSDKQPAILDWCRCVWSKYVDQQLIVKEILRQSEIVER